MFMDLWKLLTAPSNEENSSATMLWRLFAAAAFLMLYLVGFVAWRIGRPHVVQIDALQEGLYLVRKAHQYRTERKTNVLLAGSFNPIHDGHIAMLKFIAAKHCEVIIICSLHSLCAMTTTTPR